MKSKSCMRKAFFGTLFSPCILSICRILVFQLTDNDIYAPFTFVYFKCFSRGLVLILSLGCSTLSFISRDKLSILFISSGFLLSSQRSSSSFCIYRLMILLILVTSLLVFTPFLLLFNVFSFFKVVIISLRISKSTLQMSNSTITESGEKSSNALSNRSLDEPLISRSISSKLTGISEVKSDNTRSAEENKVNTLLKHKDAQTAVQNPLTQEEVDGQSGTVIKTCKCYQK